MPTRTRTTTFRLLYMALAGWSSAEATAGDPPAVAVDLQTLTSPIVIQGDDDTGYRDPAVVYHEGEWATDIHLNFLATPDRHRFLESVNEPAEYGKPKIERIPTFG